MPYINGKRVSNEEWRAAHGGNGVGWKEATGWKDGDDAPAETPVAEAPAPPAKRPRRRKKAQAEAAIAAVTGLDISLDDDEANTDASLDAFMADVETEQE